MRLAAGLESGLGYGSGAGWSNRSRLPPSHRTPAFRAGTQAVVEDVFGFMASGKGKQRAGKTDTSADDSGWPTSESYIRWPDRGFCAAAAGDAIGSNLASRVESER